MRCCRWILALLVLVPVVAFGQGATQGGSGGITALTSDVTASGTGSVASTVVGAASASSVFNSAVTAGNKAFQLVEGALLSFNGSTATSYIKGDTTTHGIDFVSNASAGGSNVGFSFTEASTPNHAMEVVNSASTVLLTVGNTGTIVASDSFQANGASNGFPALTGNGTHSVFKLISHATGTDVGWSIDTNNGTITGDIIDIKNNGTTKASFGPQGKLIFPTGNGDSVCGTATPNGTTAVTVSTTAVSSSSLIFLNHGGVGTVANYGFLYPSAITGGTSFQFKSTNASDTADTAVHWCIVN